MAAFIMRRNILIHRKGNWDDPNDVMNMETKRKIPRFYWD
jgi:hypothetical protein